jgi:hypothetical protein
MSPDAAAILRHELLAALPPIPFPLPFGFAVSSVPGTIRDRTTLLLPHMSQNSVSSWFVG